MVLSPDSASATYFFVTDLRSSDRTVRSAKHVVPGPSSVSGAGQWVYEQQTRKVRPRALAG